MGSPSGMAAYRDDDGSSYGVAGFGFGLPSSPLDGTLLNQPCPADTVAFYSSLEHEDLGQAATDALFAQTGVLLRTCAGCDSDHQTIYYKVSAERGRGMRTLSPAPTSLSPSDPILFSSLYAPLEQRLTPLPESFSIYSNCLDTWASANNILNVDFQLFGSYADLLAGTNAWHWCNYDLPNYGFPRDCGPSWPASNQFFSVWTQLNPGLASAGVSFYIVSTNASWVGALPVSQPVGLPRYIRLYFDDGALHILNLVELQAFNTKGPSPSTNLALGKPVFADSYDTRALAGLNFPWVLTDGAMNGFFATDYLSNSNGRLEPWVFVDLGRPTAVTQVVLYNRVDCCSDRVIGAKLAVLDSNQNVLFSQQITAAQLVYTFNLNLPLLPPAPPPAPLPASCGGVGPYSQAVLADSPWAWWRLGETSGAVAYECSGNANGDGTYVGFDATLGSLALDAGWSDAAEAARAFTGSSYVELPAFSSYAAGGPNFAGTYSGKSLPACLV